jgi:hypothetical protein
MTEPDPRWDDEGIPEIADDATPERTRLPEPQEQPLPAERPVAVTDFGTTAREQGEGEWLDRKLAREQPDVTPDAEAEQDEAADADPDAPHPFDHEDLVAAEAHGEAGLSPEERAIHLEE